MRPGVVRSELADLAFVDDELGIARRKVGFSGHLKHGVVIFVAHETFVIEAEARGRGGGDGFIRVGNCKIRRGIEGPVEQVPFQTRVTDRHHAGSGKDGELMEIDAAAGVGETLPFELAPGRRVQEFHVSVVGGVRFSAAADKACLEPGDNVGIFLNDGLELVEMRENGFFVGISVVHAPVVEKSDDGLQAGSANRVEIVLELGEIFLGKRGVPEFSRDEDVVADESDRFGRFAQGLELGELEWRVELFLAAHFARVRRVVRMVEAALGIGKDGVVRFIANVLRSGGRGERLSRGGTACNEYEQQEDDSSHARMIHLGRVMRARRKAARR